MKIFDLLISDIPAKTKDLSSLVKNLNKIKLGELDYVIDIFDNPVILKTSYLKWFPIHYAAMNKDYRILKCFLDLHKKHDVSLDLLTGKSKEMVPELSSIMDIAHYTKSFSHAVFAKEYGIRSNFWDNNILNLLSHYNKKTDYLNRDGMSDERFEELTNTLHDIDKRLPYPDNLLTPFIFTGRSFASELIFIDSNEFDEKEIMLKEFTSNLCAIFDFINEYVPEAHDFFSNLILRAGDELINFSSCKHVLVEDYLEFFILPFTKRIEYIIKQQDHSSFKISSLSWENKYSDHRHKQDNDESQKINFLTILKNSKNMDIAYALSKAKEQTSLINQSLYSNTEVRSIAYVIEQTLPIIMAVNLQEKLLNKDASIKVRKI